MNSSWMEASCQNEKPIQNTITHEKLVKINVYVPLIFDGESCNIIFFLSKLTLEL